MHQFGHLCLSFCLFFLIISHSITLSLYACFLIAPSLSTPNLLSFYSPFPLIICRRYSPCMLHSCLHPWPLLISGNKLAQRYLARDGGDLPINAVTSGSRWRTACLENCFAHLLCEDSIVTWSYALICLYNSLKLSKNHRTQLLQPSEKLTKKRSRALQKKNVADLPTKDAGSIIESRGSTDPDKLSVSEVIVKKRRIKKADIQVKQNTD